MYTANRKIDNKIEVIKSEKLLTIGIITKNEPERLERCLKSLITIRNSIDCEIIVTDTGSTDNTADIAEKYADKVLHFEWCDDFAAARNTGIEAAKGLWFMWIDSDEWLENPEPLIEFFRSGKYKDYENVNVSFINITDYVKNSKVHLTLCRLMLLHGSRKFTGRIHESIVATGESYTINTRVYHDGYHYIDDKEKNKKHDRNMELLLKSHNDDPKDLSIIRYITVQYRAVGDFEKAADYCEKGLNLIRKKNKINNVEKAHKMYFLILQASNYYEMKMYAESIDLLKDIKDTDAKLSSRFIDIYAILFASYSKLSNKEKTLEYCEKYLDYYSRKNDFDNTYEPVFFHLYQREEVSKTAFDFYVENTSDFDKCCNSKCKPVEYMNNIRKINSEFNMQSSTKEYIINTFKLANKLKDIKLIMDAYIELTEKEGTDYFQEFKKYFSEFIILKPNTIPSIKLELLKLKDEWDLEKLLDIFSDSSNIEKEKLHSFLLEMLGDEDNNVSIKSELLYRAVRSGLEFKLLESNIDIFSSGSISRVSAVRHEDFCENIVKYYNCMKDINYNIKFFFFITSMIESADKENLGKEMLLDILDIYSEILPFMIKEMYNTDTMTEESLNIYPPLFRFGYYLDRAFKSKESSDFVSYLREMKKSIKHCPYMGSPVKITIEKLEKELEEKDNQRKEFEALAIGVKQKIYELVSLNKKNDALALISQLQTIIPEDTELKELIFSLNKP